MMGSFKRCQQWLVAAGAVVLLAACGGQDSDVQNSPPAPTPPAAVAPAFTLQPTDTQVTAGAEARFTAGAQGSAITWAWQRSSDAGTTWVAIANATTATLTLPAVTLADNNTRLRAVAASGGLQTISSAATLTVAAQVTAPAISVQLAPAQAVAGSGATLAITASGTALQYQWQSSRDGSTWADVAGATAATLQLQNLALDANGTQYRVVVRNAAGSVTSSPVTLTVTAPAMAPAFSLQPQAASVTAPNTATFTVAVTGQPAPTLQWQRSTNAGAAYSDISGATAVSYTLPATTLADSGTLFRVQASNSAGSATSTAATLTVAAAPAAPAITTQPLDVSVVSGQTAAWSAAASGVPAPTYQWQLSSDGGTTFANINGATSSSYSLVAAVADNAKRVRVLASNSQGTATSRGAVLGVTAPISGLDGRAWALGRRFNALDELVFESRPGAFRVGAEAIMDKAGRLHIAYSTIGLVSLDFKSWVVTSLPGSPGAPPAYGTPVLLSSSTSAFAFPPSLSVSASGSVSAVWSSSPECFVVAYAGCAGSLAVYDPASGTWSAATPITDRESALLKGTTNDVGDRIALVLTNGGTDFLGGYSLAWQRAGGTAIETLALPTTSNLAVTLPPAGFSLDNNGGFVLVLLKSDITGANLIVRRGSIRTGTIGPEEPLENRSAPVAFRGMWSNSAGQTVVMWAQDNGIRETEFAATLDTSGGSWNIVDTGLPSLRNQSYQATLATDGDFYWYSFQRCTTLRRTGGAWTTETPLPSALCANVSTKQAMSSNGNLLVLTAADGRWASFDAKRQALVRNFAASNPSTGPGYVLGTDWRLLPGQVFLSDSGVGAYLSVNSFDVLPTAAAPNGDSRSATFKNVWGLYFK
jgi:hypothetical protein